MLLCIYSVQVEAAVEDILGFDGMNPQVRSVIAEVFQRRGFHITADAAIVKVSEILSNP